jgi:glycine/D-amino acid oxidase-like deaminating enzyme
MSTPTLPGRFDTAVIGGGIVGLCLTWFLAAAGVAVVCVDSGHHGGSNANAGSLHVQMQSRFMRLYPEQVAGLERALPMYVEAVAHWQQLAADVGDDIELKLTGGLMVAETDEQFAFLEQKCRREAQLGLPVRILDRTALDRVAPYLGPAVLGAELCEIEGKLNPLLANAAVRRQLRRSGAAVRDAVTLTGLERDGTGFTVATDRGTLAARRLVIAAGSGSRALGAKLGVNLPAEAEPLHMNITERTAPMIGHLVQHAERSITLKQLNAGHVVIGGGWPARLSGERGHPTVEMSSLVGNLSLAQHVVPRIGALRLLRTWAGINTTVDGRSVLGAVDSVPGLFVALPGDAGYTLGPLCARLVADVMLGVSPRLPITDYTPMRFA